MFNPYLPVNSIGDMIWVNSKEDLNGITVMPNKQKVFFLRDADNPVFFVMFANEMGMVSTTAYRFEELVEKPPEEKYVTKEEFNKLIEALGGSKND